MGQRITQVDAFTDQAFQGNPAAVCVLPAAGDEKWMQNVAREMNLSETAFLYPQGDGFHLRWFTPAVKVDLCGHATLATAHVLWEEGHLERQQTARFHTKSGLLTAECKGNWIELDFPATREEPASPPVSENRSWHPPGFEEPWLNITQTLPRVQAGCPAQDCTPTITWELAPGILR